MLEAADNTPQDGLMPSSAIDVDAAEANVATITTAGITVNEDDGIKISKSLSDMKMDSVNAEDKENHCMQLDDDDECVDQGTCQAKANTTPLVARDEGQSPSTTTTGSSANPTTTIAVQGHLVGNVMPFVASFQAPRWTVNATTTAVAIQEHQARNQRLSTKTPGSTANPTTMTITVPGQYAGNRLPVDAPGLTANTTMTAISIQDNHAGNFAPSLSSVTADLPTSDNHPTTALKQKGSVSLDVQRGSNGSDVTYGGGDNNNGLSVSTLMTTNSGTDIHSDDEQLGIYQSQSDNTANMKVRPRKSE
jgi:hypothetical protein